MQGIRFYEEYQSPSKKKSAGNCIAIFPDTSRSRMDGNVDAIGAVYYMPNSPVASTSVSWDYLGKACKRVSEARAREVHPNLFTFLD